MHNTYDRFLGSWWGGIIAQSYLDRSVSPPLEDLFTQPWFQRRSQIGKILLESPSQLDTSLKQIIEPSRSSNASFTKALQYNSNLLSLLPLIIFDRERQIFTRQSSTKRNLKSANLAKGSCDSPEVLLWSYLLTTVLNHRTNLSHQTLTKKAIFEDSEVVKSAVVEKLKLVEWAIERGITFESLKTKLCTASGWQSTAIALSWYCFASTPHEPKLSIQRAIRVEPRLSQSVAALTGTLSGAYNGIAIISTNWRVDKEVNLQERPEHYLFVELFKSWLGIYTPNLNIDLWSPEINAIAPARSIQPRPSLRIISQLA